MRNKIIVFLFGVSLVGMAVHKVDAAAAVRGAKAKTVINFSATAVRACNGPGVAYSVILATGATTDFAVLRDTNTANTSSAQTAMVAAATAAGTQVTFDPPIQFRNGISFNAPATLPSATLLYECGVIVQGY